MEPPEQQQLLLLLLLLLLLGCPPTTNKPTLLTLRATQTPLNELLPMARGWG